MGKDKDEKLSNVLEAIKVGLNTKDLITTPHWVRMILLLCIDCTLKEFSKEK